MGHSSGAHIAISVLADLLRDGRVPGDRPALSLLTLGQVVPMVSFLPGAARLRGDLAELSRSDRLAWVDVTAPGDGCCFALCDPVAVSGMTAPGKRWPLVLSAVFSKTLSPEAWRALRWRFFERHFQYLNAFDNLPDDPGAYDYFAVTAGPQTLAATLRRAQTRRPAGSSAPSTLTRSAPHDGTPRAACRRNRPPARAGCRSGVTCASFAAISCQRSPSGSIAPGWRSSGPPFFRSFLINQPDLIEEILKTRPMDFPKSDRVGEGGCVRFWGNRFS